MRSLVMALVASAQPAVAQALAGQYLVVPVTFPGDGLKLRGVLARPAGDGKFPAYVHAHGSMNVEHNIAVNPRVPSRTSRTSA